MTHDPFCQLGTSKAHTNPEDCHSCAFIAKVRADELRRPTADGWMSVRAVLAWEDQVRDDERAWAVKNAAEEIERHIVTNGTCACFEEQITDPRLHYAEIVRYTGDCLLPQVPDHQ